MEALELLPGRERRRVLHPVEEQHAVEVVALVLERAGGEAPLDLVVGARRRGRGSARGRSRGAHTSPRRLGTDRQPSLISTSSSSSGSITGLTTTVSGIGGLYG